MSLALRVWADRSPRWDISLWQTGSKNGPLSSHQRRLSSACISTRFFLHDGRTLGNAQESLLYARRGCTPVDSFHLCACQISQ